MPCIYFDAYSTLKIFIAMKDIDLRGIRNRLPHGSIARIAEETGLSVQTVSNIFNKGTHMSETIQTDFQYLFFFFLL